jgi:hypothetical protein
MTLRDKLKALTAPSREVDAEIAMMFNVPVTHLLSNPPIDATPHYTASLDDTVELVEREMPGNWDVIRLHIYNTYSGAIQGKHHSEHTIPAAALLLALLDAKRVDT